MNIKTRKIKNYRLEKTKLIFLVCFGFLFFLGIWGQPFVEANIPPSDPPDPSSSASPSGSPSPASSGSNNTVSSGGAQGHSTPVISEALSIGVEVAGGVAAARGVAEAGVNRKLIFKYECLKEGFIEQEAAALADLGIKIAWGTPCGNGGANCGNGNLNDGGVQRGGIAAAAGRGPAGAGGIEVCDDGNNAAGDGCSPQCTLEQPNCVMQNILDVNGNGQLWSVSGRYAIGNGQIVGAAQANVQGPCAVLGNPVVAGSLIVSSVRCNRGGPGGVCNVMFGANTYSAPLEGDMGTRQAAPLGNPCNPQINCPGPPPKPPVVIKWNWLLLFGWCPMPVGPVTGGGGGTGSQTPPEVSGEITFSAPSAPESSSSSGSDSSSGSNYDPQDYSRVKIRVSTEENILLSLEGVDLTVGTVSRNISVPCSSAGTHEVTATVSYGDGEETTSQTTVVCPSITYDTSGPWTATCATTSEHRGECLEYVSNAAGLCTCAAGKSKCYNCTNGEEIPCDELDELVSSSPGDSPGDASSTA